MAGRDATMCFERRKKKKVGGGDLQLALHDLFSHLALGSNYRLEIYAFCRRLWATMTGILGGVQIGIKFNRQQFEKSKGLVNKSLRNSCRKLSQTTVDSDSK